MRTLTTMGTISITGIFNFEMAHQLNGHDGLCKNIHGHSYKLVVSVKGIAIDEEGNPKNGMIIDFSDLKALVKGKILDVFDHALIIKKSGQSEELKKSLRAIGSNKTVLFEKQPTCENILSYMVDTLIANVPENIQLLRVRLWETANTFAEWKSSDS